MTRAGTVGEVTRAGMVGEVTRAGTVGEVASDGTVRKTKKEEEDLRGYAKNPSLWLLDSTRCERKVRAQAK